MPKGGFTSEQLDPQAEADIRQALLTEVQTEGTISIIVGFNAPYSPLSARDATSDAAQQVALDGLRNALIASIDVVGSVEVISASNTWAIPYVALNVDEAAYQALLASPNVTSIRENEVRHAFRLPTTIVLTGANEVWSLGADGSGQTVAVLDTGVLGTHPAFTGRVVAEACYSGTGASTTLCPNTLDLQIGAGAADPTRCDSLMTGDDGCYHGTHVSGISLGADPSKNVYGIARGANLIGVQVFSYDPGDGIGAYDSDIVAGLNYVYGLRFTYSITSVNLSLGGGLFSATCNTLVPAVTTAFANLRAAGIMPVVASGNDGRTNRISYPACISTAVSVGATTDFDARASFSNSLPSLMTLFAPGSAIYSAMIPGSAPDDGTGYGTIGGTSMATPHVNGAFALLRDAVPAATTEQILTALRNTGKPITVPGGTTPRIDLLAAYNSLIGAPEPVPPPTVPTPPVPPNDQSAGAYVISAMPYTTFQTDIYYATMTGGDPATICSAPMGSVVWYRFMQSTGTTRQVVINTIGTTYDTALGVYTTPGGSAVVCNDDIDFPNGNYQSQLTLSATSGTTYYIAIGNWGGATQDPSSLRLNLYEQSTSPAPVTTEYSLVGYILLQGRPAAPNPKYIQNVHVIVKSIYGGAAVFDGTVVSDQYGRFTVNNLPSGTFTVWVKSDHGLAQSGIGGVSQSVLQTFNTLLEGDANNDNVVGLSDFSLLANSFGIALGEGGYDARADFNGDDLISLTDFSLLASNYGLSGAAVP